MYNLKTIKATTLLLPTTLVLITSAPIIANANSFESTGGIDPNNPIITTTPTDTVAIASVKAEIISNILDHRSELADPTLADDVQNSIEPRSVAKVGAKAIEKLMSKIGKKAWKKVVSQISWSAMKTVVKYMIDYKGTADAALTKGLEKVGFSATAAKITGKAIWAISSIYIF